MWPFSRRTKAEGQPQAAKSRTPGDYFTLIVAPDGWLIPAVGFQDSDLDRLVMASTWSWAAITGNARAMASLPPLVQVRADGRWQNAPDDHPLQKLLQAPMGPDKTPPYWGWAEFLQVIAMHYYIVGNAFLRPAIVDSGRRIFSLYPILSPQSVAADEDPITRLPLRYTVAGTSYHPSQLINIRAPSPSSWWRGMSPLQAAMRPIDTDYYAGERQRYNLRNKVAPGLIVSIDTPLGPTEEQRTRLKQQLIDGYQGAEKDGTPWVIGGAATVHPPPSAQDLQYFDTRTFSRDEILAVIGMPPPVAGVLDRAILNNFREANHLWWTHYLFPVLGQIYGAINTQAIHRVYGQDVRLWYDLTGTDIAIQLFADRVELGLKLAKLGYPTNMITERLGLEMPYHPALDLPNTGMVQAGHYEDLAQAIAELGGKRSS